MKQTILAATLAVTTTFAFATDEPDTRTPLEAYRGNTAAGMKLCELQYELAALIQKNGQDMPADVNPMKCITDLLDKGKRSFTAANKSIKKAAARDLLKTYHSIWVPAVRGIPPESGELVISYKRRRSESWARLNETWERLQLEVE